MSQFIISTLEHLIQSAINYIYKYIGCLGNNAYFYLHAKLWEKCHSRQKPFKTRNIHHLE